VYLQKIVFNVAYWIVAEQMNHTLRGAMDVAVVSRGDTHGAPDLDTWLDEYGSYRMVPTMVNKSALEYLHPTFTEVGRRILNALKNRHPIVPLGSDLLTLVHAGTIGNQRSGRNWRISGVKFQMMQYISGSHDMMAPRTALPVWTGLCKLRDYIRLMCISIASYHHFNHCIPFGITGDMVHDMTRDGSQPCSICLRMMAVLNTVKQDSWVTKISDRDEMDVISFTVPRKRVKFSC